MNNISLTDGQCEVVEKALVNQVALHRKQAAIALQRNEWEKVNVEVEQIRQIETLLKLIPFKI